MRILFTGGGTGGHIYPIIAVSQELKKMMLQKGILPEFYYMGSPGIFATALEQNGIIVSSIVSAKWRRYFDLRNFFDIFKLFLALLQSFWKIFWLMPEVIFSKGGTGALPVVLAGWFYHIPVIIHESDATAGLTNLISGRFARKIGIAFASAQQSFLENVSREDKKTALLDKIALVGNPVRSFLLAGGQEKINQAELKKSLGFDAQKPLIMVMGGSQGATRLNDFFIQIAGELLKNGNQVIHQTGAANFNNFRTELNLTLQSLGMGGQAGDYVPIPYFDDNIKEFYQAADIVVSRAGGGAIFEIAACGKPSILIPLPEAAGTHQLKNALEYYKTGACIIFEESNLSPNVFLNQISRLLSDRAHLQAMGEAAFKFFRPDAAHLISEKILEIGLT